MMIKTSKNRKKVLEKEREYKTKKILSDIKSVDLRHGLKWSGSFSKTDGMPILESDDSSNDLRSEKYKK